MLIVVVVVFAKLYTDQAEKFETDFSCSPFPCLSAPFPTSSLRSYSTLSLACTSHLSSPCRGGGRVRVLLAAGVRSQRPPLLRRATQRRRPSNRVPAADPDRHPGGPVGPRGHPSNGTGDVERDQSFETQDRDQVMLTEIETVSKRRRTRKRRCRPRDLLRPKLWPPGRRRDQHSGRDTDSRRSGWSPRWDRD